MLDGCGETWIPFAEVCNSLEALVVICSIVGYVYSKLCVKIVCIIKYHEFMHRLTRVYALNMIGIKLI